MVVWQLEFFTTFKLRNPNVLMMLTRFHYLKPWFVKRLKEWNTCRFKYLTKLNKMRLGLNAMKVVGKDVHN